jgi:hypothetical protein
MPSFAVPFNARESDQSVDCFCFGAIAYTLLTGRPFEGDTLPLLPDSIPNCFLDVIGACWHADPDRRPRFEHIVRRFLQDELTLPLDPKDVFDLRDFESRTVSPSFTNRSMIGALCQLHIVTQANRRLAEEVRQLELHVESLFEAVKPPPPPEPFPSSHGDPPPEPTVSRPVLAHPPQPQQQPAGPEKLRKPTLRFEAVEYPDRRRSIQVSGTHMPIQARRQSVIVHNEKNLLTAVRGESEVSSLSIGTFSGQDFAFEGDSWNGIFAHLTAEAHGNIAEMGMIKLSGNSVDRPREIDLPKVVDFTWKKCWISKQDEEPHIQFDFLKSQVIVTHYSIRTYASPKGFSHLKSWKLIGRVPPGDWIEIDAQEGNDELNGRQFSQTWECAFPIPVQVLRIVQTGPSHYGDKCLVLTNVEFFGHIV